jgi:hypothetical protein
MISIICNYTWICTYPVYCTDIEDKHISIWTCHCDDILALFYSIISIIIILQQYARVCLFLIGMESLQMPTALSSCPLNNIRTMYANLRWQEDCYNLSVKQLACGHKKIRNTEIPQLCDVGNIITTEFYNNFFTNLIICASRVTNTTSMQ